MKRPSKPFLWLYAVVVGALLLFLIKEIYGFTSPYRSGPLLLEHDDKALSLITTFPPDLEICRQQTKASYHWCLLQVALIQPTIKEAIEVCDLFPYADGRDNCIMQVATYFEDETLCKKMSENPHVPKRDCSEQARGFPGVNQTPGKIVDVAPYCLQFVDMPTKAMCLGRFSGIINDDSPCSDLFPGAIVPDPLHNQHYILCTEVSHAREDWRKFTGQVE